MSEGWPTPGSLGTRREAQPIPWGSGRAGGPPDSASKGADGPLGADAVFAAVRLAVHCTDEGVVAAALAASKLNPRIRIVHIAEAARPGANGALVHDVDVSIVDPAVAGRANGRRPPSADAKVRKGHQLLVMDCHDPGAAALLKSTHARGCVSPQITPALLARAVCAVAQGGLWLPRRVLDEAYLRHVGGDGNDPATRPDGSAELSPREHEVWNLARSGFTNKEIARQLGITASTVKKHLHSAYEKSGLHRRRRQLPP